MRLILASLLLFGATQAAAQPYAYVPNYSGNTVQVIDSATNTVVASIPVGVQPWGVSVSPDQSFVYINHESASPVAVIETATNTVIANFGGGSQYAYGVQFSPDGSTAYTTTVNPNILSVVDTSTHTVTASLPTNASPYDVELNADGSKLYVGHYSGTDILVFDTATNTQIGSINIGGSSYQMAMSPNGVDLYVASPGLNAVAIVDTTTDTLTTTVPLGAAIWGIALSADGSQAFVTTSANTVLGLDLATNTVTSTMGVSNPWGIDFTPDGSLVYVTSRNNGSLLTLVDPATETLAGTIAVQSGIYYSLGDFFANNPIAPPIPGGVQLDASPAAPLTYADEIIATPAAPVTLLNPAGDLNLSAPLGYNFSAGEVRYARFECDNGLRFNAGSTAEYDGAGNASLGAINGLGGSSLTFSVTANDNTVVENDRLVVTGERSITNTNDVTCRYGLYDFPSQAQAGGANGRVYTVAGPYLRFAASYALEVDSQGNPVANVESADPAYSQFDGAAPTANPDLGQIGGFSYGTRFDMTGAVQPLTPAGVMITLVDLMDSDTALVFEGDFDAANDVFLSTSADCSVNVQSADGFDATEAVFTIGSTDAMDHFLCYEVGTTPIPVGTYTVTLDALSASPAVYAVTDIGPLALGEITRNGTELQAPLAQVPAGYLSRMVLTNTGSRDRDYVIEVMGETGNVISSANLTGTVAAGKTLVVDLTTVLTGFTAAPRATLNVTVSGPNNQIQGLYQIVNPNSGTVSNHVMVRPGTN